MANVVEITLRAIDKTKDGFTMPLKNLSDLEKAAGKVAPAFEALAATVVAAFGVMAEHAIETADQMGKFAQKTGTAVESFSAMAYGANLSNVSAEGLSHAFKDLSKNISEAQIYGSEAGRMFDQLGISTRDANGSLLSSDQILLKIADRFADTADGATKTEAAVKLFGKAGQDMIPFLNQGASGIKEMNEEAGLFHQIFSGPAAQSANEFNDGLTKIKKAIQGIVNAVVVEFLPSVAIGITAFVEWIKTSGVLEGAINTLIDVFKVFRYVIELVMSAGEALWDVFKGIAEGIADVFVAVKIVLEDIAKTMGSLFAAAEEMFKGNWSNAKYMANQALEGLKTDFTVWKNQVISIGADTAKGFTEAFKTLARGPVAPDLFQGQTPTTQGPPTSPKGQMPNISSAGAGKNQDDILPSGYTWEAYKLDLDMQQKTRQALLDADGLKMTLDQKQAADLAIKMGAEQEAYQKRLEQITNLHLEEGENYALTEQAFAEHAARMKKISTEMAKEVQNSHLQMFNGVASILGSFAQLAQTFGRKGFLAYQAFSIGQAIISTATGAARALADFPWPLSAVMAAAVSAAGAAQIATIVAQKPPQAHAGASYIPEEATYLLSGGERVIAPEQNRDLTNFLQRGGSGPTEINFTFDGQVFGRAIGHWARGGQIEIPVRAIV